ncbi:MAG: hypothetical protein K6T75_00775 [Acetobacteraceae bacterium]|nr:hypothetical protein [Acetobacteraceae bacterium]
MSVRVGARAGRVTSLVRKAVGFILALLGCVLVAGSLPSWAWWVGLGAASLWLGLWLLRGPA